MCSFIMQGCLMVQKCQYLVWPPFASSLMAVRSCWILAGTGTRCHTCQFRATSSPGSRPWPWACQLQAPSKLSGIVLCIKTVHFSVAFYCDQSKHTCVLIIPFNQHPALPHLRSGGWIILAKGANRDLNKFAKGGNIIIIIIIISSCEKWERKQKFWYFCSA